MLFRQVFFLTVFLIGQTTLAQVADANRSEDAAGDGLSRLHLPSDVENLVSKRDYPAAERLLIAKIQGPSHEADLLPALGGIYFLDRQYLSCASALEKAKIANVLDERSQFTLAMAYVKLGHNDWAQTELLALMQAHPKQALYPYWSGRLDFVDQHFRSAIGKLKTAIALDPKLVKAYDSLALCYEAIGDTSESLKAFEIATQKNRDSVHLSPWPPLDYGEFLFKLAKYSDAKPYFEEAIRYAPELAQAHFKLGLAYEKLKSDQAARNELEKAISLNRSYAEPYYALSRVYRRQGEERLADQAASTFEALNKQQ